MACSALGNSETRKHCGFTLIELLVVVSIIALLVSILMPALGRARQMAKDTVCKTRMRSIGQAFSMYLGDNADKMPSSPWNNDNWPNDDDLKPWFHKLGPYYDRTGLADDEKGTLLDYELLRCTTQDKWTDYARSGEEAAREGTKVVGWEGIYGYNFFMTESTKDGDQSNDIYAWQASSQFKSPSELPVLADLNTDDPIGANQTGFSGWRMGFQNPHPLAYDQGWQNGEVRSRRHDYYGPAPNHQGKCNFLMADFHVEGRDICKEGVWPWLGDTPAEQMSGKAFHPVRKPGTQP